MVNVDYFMLHLDAISSPGRSVFVAARRRLAIIGVSVQQVNLSAM
jgi:hypothetical protein